MRKRSRKPKHVYNAADVAPPQASWKSSIYKPVKKVLLAPETELPHSVGLCCILLSPLQNPVSQRYLPYGSVSVACVASFAVDTGEIWRPVRLSFQASVGWVIFSIDALRQLSSTEEYVPFSAMPERGRAGEMCGLSDWVLPAKDPQDAAKALPQDLDKPMVLRSKDSARGKRSRADVSPLPRPATSSGAGMLRALPPQAPALALGLRVSY